MVGLARLPVSLKCSPDGARLTTCHVNEWQSSRMVVRPAYWLPGEKGAHGTSATDGRAQQGWDSSRPSHAKATEHSRLEQLTIACHRE